MYLKELHPIDTSKYAIAQVIGGGPAFNWWVPHIIKKRAYIIYLVRKSSARYLKTNHKFGVELPKSEKHALKPDS